MAPKCWRIWRKRRIWRFDEMIMIMAVDEMIRRDKFTQVEGRLNVAEFGENGDCSEISPRLRKKW